jgi:acetyl-CoA acyltransferase 1
MAAFKRVARNVLQKGPNDVVLLSAVRSPINRSFKGGYKDAYPEDILMPVSKTEWTQMGTFSETKLR